jgi:hypothetical protein
MRIGLDFDNTIVCYDSLFHRVCVEKNLIPAIVPANKSDVRNFLRKSGREDDWTEMQGYVYGARMLEAAPFPGILDFLATCHAKGLECRIISHKTRHPYKGERYDLHQAAMNWLEHYGFLVTEKTGLTRERIFLEVTKSDKVRRIATCQCTHFVDDLPEFLEELKGLSGLHKFLFDPNRIYTVHSDYTIISDWQEAYAALSSATNVK